MNHILSSKPSATRSYYFVIEVGPAPEMIEAFMIKVFAAMGLNTPDRIKAFDNYERINSKVAHFYQDNFNHNRNDPDVMAALKNEHRTKRRIFFYVPRRSSKTCEFSVLICQSAAQAKRHSPATNRYSL